MHGSPALPFTLRKSKDVFSGSVITTTTETVHGLLHLSEDHLLVQWRLARKTDHLGGEIRSEEELETVRQVTVPLNGIAGAVVRHRWWEWPRGSRLVLTASDLSAFEEVAGQAGLKMAHPAQLVVKVARRDRLAAEEFAAEVTLAIVQESVAPGRRAEGLPAPEAGDPRLPEPPNDSE